MRRRSSIPALAVVAASSLVGLAGCPGSLEDPGRFAGELGTGGGSGGGGCADVPTYLAKTCGNAGCHSATAPQQDLDLVSPDLLSRLSGQMAIEGPGLLIDPSDPSSSVLYTKMIPPPPFGSLMPLGGSPLSQAELACVLAWISSP